MSGQCSRCKSESFEVGAPVIKVAKTREMRVSIREHPKCALISYRRMRRLGQQNRPRNAYLTELSSEIGVK